MKVELLEHDENDAYLETGVALCEEIVKTLRVNGYQVPYLTVCEYADNAEVLSIIVDHRLAYDIPRELLPTVAGLVANAMAVAAGRTSFGQNSNVRNPFGDALAGYPTERILGTPATSETVKRSNLRPIGCINRIVEADGHYSCNHDDHTPCDRSGHQTITTWEIVDE